MDYTMKERHTKTTVSFGFAIPGIVEFGFNFNNAKYTKSVQKIRRASGKVRFVFAFLLTPSQPPESENTKQTLQIYDLY